MLRDDGTRELQSECGYHGDVRPRCVQTRGDFIIVGDRMRSISLLIYKVSNKPSLNIPLPYNLLSRHLMNAYCLLIQHPMSYS